MLHLQVLNLLYLEFNCSQIWPPYSFKEGIFNKKKKMHYNLVELLAHKKKNTSKKKHKKSNPQFHIIKEQEKARKLHHS